jgi:transposase
MGPAIFYWTLLPGGLSCLLRTLPLFRLLGVAMLRFDPQQALLIGPEGSLPVSPKDEVTAKLVMLLLGECLGYGPKQAAEAFGYSKQRYFQLLEAFAQQGAAALVNHKTGPKRNYRRTDEAIRQAVRQRFLDPEASAEVIAQRLRQCELPISTRSVERIIEQFGLQKKTPPLPTQCRACCESGGQPRA